MSLPGLKPREAIIGANVRDPGCCLGEVTQVMLCEPLRKVLGLKGLAITHVEKKATSTIVKGDRMMETRLNVIVEKLVSVIEKPDGKKPQVRFREEFEPVLFGGILGHFSYRKEEKQRISKYN